MIGGAVFAILPFAYLLLGEILNSIAGCNPVIGNDGMIIFDEGNERVCSFVMFDMLSFPSGYWDNIGPIVNLAFGGGLAFLGLIFVGIASAIESNRKYSNKT